MAKIAEGTFRDWHDTETINATEYKREREILKVAINDSEERLGAIEEYTSEVGLMNVQMQKITNDIGGVKIGIMSTDGDILASLYNEGQGIHTFYAVSGSKNLPPTNLSIRGIAHFTSPNIGWVYATDYKNNIFTNYYDSDAWGGWNALATGSGLTDNSGNVKLNLKSTTDDILARVLAEGEGVHTFRAIFGSKNLPDTDKEYYGFAQVAKIFKSGYSAYIYAISNDNKLYTNYYEGGWKGWRSYTPYEGSLWDGTALLASTTTITPSKKLSQCVNGWVLMWSDVDGTTPNNYNWQSTYVPKFMGMMHSGNEWSVPLSPASTAGQLDSVAEKKFKIYDDKIVGHAENLSGLSTDVCLRYVLEY